MNKKSKPEQVFVIFSLAFVLCLALFAAAGYTGEYRGGQGISPPIPYTSSVLSCGTVNNRAYSDAGCNSCISSGYVTLGGGRGYAAGCLLNNTWCGLRGPQDIEKIVGGLSISSDGHKVFGCGGCTIIGEPLTVGDFMMFVGREFRVLRMHMENSTD